MKKKLILYSGFELRVQNVLQEGTVCGHCIPEVQGAFYPKNNLNLALWLHIIGNTSYMYLKEFHIYVKTQLKEKKENSFNVILFKYCVPHILMYVSQKLVNGFVNNLLFSKLFY